MYYFCRQGEKAEIVIYLNMTRINCSGDNKEAKKKLNIKRQPSIRLIATITILISNAWHENLAFLCGIFRDYILQQTSWN